MIDKLLSIVAPHHCSGCGKSGSLLCEDCKYNIIYETKDVCFVCQRPCGTVGLCNTCNVPYSRAWCVGERKDALQRLIGLYKFERTKSAYLVLADLLALTLPDLPDDIVVVPVPTVLSHIRQRGYDHTLLFVKRFAKIKQLKLSRVLIRATNTTQRHTSASRRKSQAEQAFTVNQRLDKNTTYLLIDDVATTGATLRYAAEALKNAGAGDVWVAAIAHQILR
jgi:ComF family protein